MICAESNSLRPADLKDSQVRPEALEDPSVGKSGRSVVIFRRDLLPLSETFILDQFQHYRKWNAHLVGYQRISGLEIGHERTYTIPKTSIRFVEYMLFKIRQYGQYIGLYPPYLRNLFLRIRPSLIHAHFGYDAILVSGLARRLKIPMVVTFHGDDILRSRESWERGDRGHFFRLYPAKLNRLFNDRNVHFVSVSDAMRTRAIDVGVPPEKITTLYTGCDDTYFSPLAKKPFSNEILFVGRLAEFKGCIYLLEAMKRVQAEVPSAVLRVIGDGPLRQELEQFSKDHSLSVIFEGPVPRVRVRQAMQEASIFCLPSISEETGSFESFGMVILEAQMCGLPVVTSARGGSEILVHGTTGFVFPEKDSRALANHLISLLQNDELRSQVAERGRNKAIAEFSLQQCTSRIESFYDSVQGYRK